MCIIVGICVVCGICLLCCSYLGKYEKDRILQINLEKETEIVLNNSEKRFGHTKNPKK